MRKGLILPSMLAMAVLSSTAFVTVAKADEDDVWYCYTNSDGSKKCERWPV
jgi:hypothetical protein